MIIFKKRGEYRAVIHVGENPKFTQEEEIVYQDSKKVNTLTQARSSRMELRDKAKNWARKQGINFVHNLDT